MKRIAFALSLLSAATLAQAQEYTVQGTTDSDLKQVIFHTYETRHNDTIQVVNGKFSIKGDAQGHRFAMIVGGQKSVPLYLEGNIKVDLAQETVTGNAENEGFSQASRRLGAIQEKANVLRQEEDEYRQKNQPLPEEVKARLTEEMGKLGTAYLEELISTCKNNMDKKFPAFYIAQSYYNFPKADIIAMHDAKAAFMSEPVVAFVDNMIEGWRRQEVGAMFTDLTMNDTTGTARKLSEFVGKGKYVLIDFWASWCGPCRASMPAIKKLYNEYHAKGFDIVGISFDQKKQDWVKAIHKLDLPWHHISDLKGWKCEAGAIYGISSIPATLLIGPDGKIIAAGLHAEQLAEKLAEIFPN